MRTNYGIGQLSAAEKSDILDQHKTLYNGYRTMQPEVSNTQPLYVFDPAGDKHGLVVNNKGEEFEFTTKTLEFACKREIEECEFKNFITILKSLGFSSDCGTTIKFCGNLNTNNIYEYNFSTEENIANTIADKHQKNKSRYSTIKLN